MNSTTPWALCLAALFWGACGSGPDVSESTQAQRLEDSAHDELPGFSGTWSLAYQAELGLDPTRAQLLLSAQGQTRSLGEALVGLPSISADGRRVVWSERAVGEFRPRLRSIEWLGQEWSDVRTLLEDFGQMDRVAISPDGKWVAFVSAPERWATVFVMSFEGGDPRALTNTDLHPRKGELPAGLVLPPHLGPPRFNGASLVWLAPDGEHRVDLP